MNSNKNIINDTHSKTEKDFNIKPTNILIQIKEYTFKYFLSLNANRLTSSIYGNTLLTVCFLQIASVMKFPDESEYQPQFNMIPLDEFAVKCKPLSILLNFPLYCLQRNISHKLLNILHILIYIYTIILLILIVTFVVIVIKDMKHPKSLLSVLSDCLMFTQWILVIPILILLAQVSFENELTKAIIHVVIIIFYICLIYVLFYFNLIARIDKRDFFYSTTNTFELNVFYLILISFLGLILIQYASIYAYIVYIAVILCIFKIIYDILSVYIYIQYDYFTSYTIATIVLCDRLIVSIVNKAFIHYLHSMYTTYYLSSVVCFCFAFVIIRNLVKRRILRTIVNVPFEKIKTYEECIAYVNSLLYLTSTNNELIIKTGGLTAHYEKCVIEENNNNNNDINHINKCPLHTKVQLYLPLQNSYSQTHINKVYYNDHVVVMHTIKEILKYKFERYKNNFSYCIHYILFIVYYFGNYEQALTEIEIAKTIPNLTLCEQFLLFLLTNYANDCIIKYSENNPLHDEHNNTHGNKGLRKQQQHQRQKQKGNTSTKWSINSILSVIAYDRLIKEIKNYIYIALEGKRELWHLFEMEDIIVEELYEAGRNFFKTKSIVNYLWKKINIITNNIPDPEITKIYADYLDKICDDKIESQYLLESKTSMNFSRTSDELFNNKYKSDTCVVIIESSSFNNPGKITYCNQALVQLLGYSSKKELIGNNIKMCIPGDIGRYHDDIIRSYFEKGRSEYLKQTLNDFCVKSKEKYLIPIHLVVSIVPHLGKSLEGIGLIRPKVKADEIIMCDYNGMIEATTLKIAQLLNLMPNLIEKSDYYVQAFFVETMFPDKDGIPKFFKEEYFKHKIDIKCDISCPKVNLINVEEYNIKTRNISPVKVQINPKGNHTGENAAFQNMLDRIKSINNPFNKYKGYESVMLTNNNNNTNIKAQQQLMKDSFVSNETITSFLGRSRYLNSSNIHNMNTHKGKKKKVSLISMHIGNNPEYETTNFDMYLLTQFKSFYTLKLPAIKKTYGSNSTWAKLDEIYDSIIKVHSVHNFSEKGEVVVTHYGLKIMNNTISIRLLYIPFNSLFENKREDDFTSDSSELNFFNNKADQGKVLKSKEGSSQALNLMYETGSITGKDMNLILQKHLKKLKQEKYNKYHTHKIIGITMSLTVITSIIAVIIVFKSFFSFISSFYIIIHDSFALNSEIISLTRCATLYYFQRIFSISNDEFKSKLNNSIDKLLLLFQTYFSELRHNYDLDEYLNEIENTYLSYSLSNNKINFMFLDALYHFIESKLLWTKSSLRDISQNIIGALHESFTLINVIIHNGFEYKTKMFFYTLNTIVIVSLLLLIIFVFILFISYKRKKLEQLKILSAYEQIKNNEIERVLKRVSNYEKKYISHFKNVDEYKKKKIQFNKKANSKLLLDKKLLSSLKQHKASSKERKATENEKEEYNILSSIKNATKKSKDKAEENETLLQNKKHLIIRDHFTVKYIVSFLFVFTFVVVYGLLFFIFIFYITSLINTSKRLLVTALTNELFIDYQTYKLDYTFENDFHLIKSNETITHYIKLVNYAHRAINKLTIDILANKQLFNKNISIIINNDMCNVITIPFCKDERMRFTLMKGFRSLTKFYIQSLKEGFTHYADHYRYIEDLRDVFLHAKIKAVRNIAENLKIVIHEFVAQLLSGIDKVNVNGLIVTIVVGIVLGVVFLIGVVYRMNMFIDDIKEEEVLCNQLITELPNDILQTNSELTMVLTGSLMNTIAANIKKGN